MTTFRGRYAFVDVLRGGAIVLMVGYHFAFDLRVFGLADFDFYHGPFWLVLRTLIVSLFLGVMGVSLYLATARDLHWPAYLRRLGWITGGAALVSLATYLLFPASMIFFGVLHFIAVASVLGLLFLRLRWWNLFLGVVCVAVGLGVQSALFDQQGLRWIGLMTHKPVTEDYVPLLPWFGVVLWGLFLGWWVFGRGTSPVFTAWEARRGLSRLLQWGGRRSLFIYLVHQPVLFGAFMLLYGVPPSVRGLG